MATETQFPFVTIIIPCRNEADFIERCIASVLACQYPYDKLEVLAVDGMSSDQTRDIILTICKKDGRLELLDNPQKIVPAALNIGIGHAKGDIIIFLSGHAEVPNDFISQSVVKLTAHKEAWCVGGPIKSVSPNYIGNTIAAAMSSPCGVGNAMFRLGNFEGYVDTIAFGAYWRWVFDKIGMFDEELVRNQDDELNYRLILHGGKILMTPDIHSTYFTRSSLKKLWRQYFQYGFWRIRTMQKHRRPATLRQTIPLLLVLSMLVLIMAGILWKPLFWLLLIEVCLYFLLLMIGFLDVSRKSGVKQAVLSPLIFIILHFSYGIGGLYGIVRLILLQGMGMPKPSQIKMSR
jgi:glycosyltransferase involved in cell wall biosynthesis